MESTTNKILLLSFIFIFFSCSNSDKGIEGNQNKDNNIVIGDNNTTNIYTKEKKEKKDIFKFIELGVNKTYISDYLETVPITNLWGEGDLWKYNDILILSDNTNEQITFMFDYENPIKLSYLTSFSNKTFSPDFLFGKSKFKDLPIPEYLSTSLNSDCECDEIKGHGSAGGSYAYVSYYIDYYYYYITFGTTAPSNYIGLAASGDYIGDEDYLKSIGDDLVNFIIISEKKPNALYIFRLYQYINGGTG